MYGGMRRSEIYLKNVLASHLIWVTESEDVENSSATGRVEDHTAATRGYGRVEQQAPSTVLFHNNDHVLTKLTSTLLLGQATSNSNLYLLDVVQWKVTEVVISDNTILARETSFTNLQLGPLPERVHGVWLKAQKPKKWQRH